MSYKYMLKNIILIKSQSIDYSWTVKDKDISNELKNYYLNYNKCFRLFY